MYLKICLAKKERKAGEKEENSGGETAHHAIRPVPHISHVWSTSVSFDGLNCCIPGARVTVGSFLLSPLAGNDSGSTNRNPEKELGDG